MKIYQKTIRRHFSNEIPMKVAYKKYWNSIPSKTIRYVFEILFVAQLISFPVSFKCIIFVVWFIK